MLYFQVLHGGKDGTFTNTERKVQRVRKAVHGARSGASDWKILEISPIKWALHGTMLMQMP
jgi:predicted molibdopterin-dependent oxidoreductase YjgC